MPMLSQKGQLIHSLEELRSDLLLLRQHVSKDLDYGDINSIWSEIVIPFNDHLMQAKLLFPDQPKIQKAEGICKYMEKVWFIHYAKKGGLGWVIGCTERPVNDLIGLLLNAMRLH